MPFLIAVFVAGLLGFLCIYYHATLEHCKKLLFDARNEAESWKRKSMDLLAKIVTRTLQEEEYERQKVLTVVGRGTFAHVEYVQCPRGDSLIRNTIVLFEDGSACSLSGWVDMPEKVGEQIVVRQWLHPDEIRSQSESIMTENAYAAEVDRKTAAEAEQAAEGMEEPATEAPYDPNEETPAQ